MWRVSLTSLFSLISLSYYKYVNILYIYTHIIYTQYYCRHIHRMRYKREIRNGEHSSTLSLRAMLTNGISKYRHNVGIIIIIRIRFHSKFTCIKSLSLDIVKNIFFKRKLIKSIIIYHEFVKRSRE